MITTIDNAVDSLEQMAAAGERTDPLAAKAALWWGWHAVVLLAHHRLRPARDTFDHWFWDYLEAGEPALDVDRDARWEERQRLSLVQLLDVLSEEQLPILEPQFYQGWQDRGTRCRTLRLRAAEAVGTSIGGPARERLLFLLAAYHRLLRMPAPAEVDLDQVRADLPVLLDLAASLVDRSHEQAKPVMAAIERCRSSLG